MDSDLKRLVHAFNTCMRMSHFWKYCLYAALIFIFAAAFAVLYLYLRSHQLALFTVVSPANEQVVHPGDTFQVAVQPASGVNLDSISVWGPLNPSLSMPAGAIGENGAPVSIIVPQNYPIGPVKLGILGKTVDGRGQNVDITVNVQTLAKLSSIELTPLSLELVAPGTGSANRALGQDIFGIIGLYSDGVKRDIVHAPGIVISSENPKVATVDANGKVTAVAPGVTSIKVTDGTLIGSAMVTVSAK